MSISNIIFLTGRTADYNDEPSSYVGAGIVFLIIIIYVVIKCFDKIDSSTPLTEAEVKAKKNISDSIKKEVEQEHQNIIDTYGDHCVVMGETVLLKEGGIIKQFRDSEKSSSMILKTTLKFHIISNHPERYYSPSIALKCLGVNDYGYYIYLPLQIHYADIEKHPHLEDDYEFIAKYGELAYVISKQDCAKEYRLDLNKYLTTMLPSWANRLCNAIPDNYNGLGKEILERYREKPFTSQSGKWINCI